MKEITQELIKIFELHLIEEEKSPSTVRKYVKDISEFASWVQNTELSKRKILDYKNFMKDKYAPQSVNSKISSLNSFFNFNKWYELKVKFLKIQRRIFASEERELTKNEYERLLEAAKENKRLYLLMQTICSTGIRVSEHKFITVSAINKGQALINNKGKMRTVFLPGKLCKTLKKYAAKQGIKEGAVFVTKTGRPLDRSNIWSDMKKLCRIANVAREKVFPHNLRHLFARTYYSIQKDMVRLADILGHSSINTTRIYTAESGLIHKKQIEKLGLLLC